MQLIVTDSDGKALAALDDFELDMEIGDEGNDFELSLPDSAPRLSKGCMCYCPGTDWGGVVDSEESETLRTGPTLKYSGRTWSGVLANRVVLPPSGQGYYESSGEANACIRDLIGKLGLSETFSTPMADSGIELDYRWERFCDAWHGLLACLAASSAKPVMRWSGGMVEISAAPAEAYGTRPGEDVSIKVKRAYRPINHLVCAGSGELADRAVVHFYADEHGAVSHTQSLFGIDELSALYDYTNASESELEDEGAKKLADYQVEGSVEASVLDESVRLDVGDSIAGRESAFGLEVTAPIVSKVVTVKAGVEKVEYDCGQASTTQSLTATSESSGGGGGGASYTAGEGIDITGNVISADVTEADVSRLESDIDEAYETASNAAASAGAKVSGVEGAAPIDASMDEATNEVTVSHAASGVTAGTYGPASSLTPGWGENVTIPPRLTVNATGHVTKAEGRTLKIPASTATQSEAGLMSAEDKQAVDAMPDDYATKEHVHDASDIETGTLPIARGGTGKATAKAAQNALLGNMNELTSAPGDTGEFVMVYTTPNDTQGAVFKRKITKVWEWFKAKTDALYATKTHTHPYAGSDTAGGAAKEAVKLETPRTIAIAGAVNGSASFDGSANVTITVTGDSEAAGFLAAHPAGSYWETSSDENPADAYGGTWERIESPGRARLWHRLN